MHVVMMDFGHGKRAELLTARYIKAQRRCCGHDLQPALVRVAAQNMHAGELAPA